MCEIFSSFALGGSIDYNHANILKLVIQNIPSTIRDPRAEVIVKKVNALFLDVYYENLNDIKCYGNKSLL